MDKNHGMTLVHLLLFLLVAFAAILYLYSKTSSANAKLKVLEVEAEVGKWNKAQIAYALDVGQLGSFTEIGYRPPGVLAPDGESSRSKAFLYSSDSDIAKGRWRALNSVRLGSCSRGEGVWAAFANPEAILANAHLEDPVPDCMKYTPGFKLAE
jgi:hypothetical protein